MKFSNLLRQHAAALRALLVLTVILGIGYPVFIWLVAQIPGLRDNADGSLIQVNGKPLGSSLIGQSFTDADGNPLPRYFQSRPSMAGDGYDPMSTGASNLGPESIVDQPDKPSLLTLVCSRSAAVGKLDGVDGARPFCTGSGVGAVLSVIGPRDAGGNVVHPTQVVSVNEPCDTTKTPFLNTYEDVRVECAKPGENYSAGLIVPIRGSAPADPAVPADAVTASGSGLDPNISPAYADLQVNRVAKARGLNPDLVRTVVAEHTDGRTLGFLGEPRVNVLQLNIALDSLQARG
ncbi:MULTISPECIES: potassium-transporting ATPase subunit C [Mycobacterium]|uniref:Potassium-transporting ATPase KdpC subunit n=1 Tax=Mycobacterium syngnathidarum TaxID=1908205 RepID=A0A1Q9W935_9MYCO|nr:MULTISPECIES: potassium-transporting ATPase subunit C [Mycobacterium]MCG7609728.1 potassium-transporting ATPase subunit C [Mycobacterium sp. CnD-18-1]OHU01307.1 K+-transporting ATPase subunit C [Mycobacterium syngnathidarum]OLT95337.1 K+-transporting ATPase subunit C [Mycobacterium syngnathidarum]